jgi:TonB family protein
MPDSRVRWDSPFVLATAGALAVHIALITGGDALVVTHPPRAWVPAPHIEMIEVEVQPELVPPPPPLPAPVPEPAPIPVEPARPAPRAAHVRAAPSPVRSAPEPPPPVAPTEPTSGGDPVVHMDDIAPSATGVGVAVGKPETGHIGRGGRGGGTGAGSGSSSEPPRPVSVASIKTRAMPKGDYGFFDAGKDYPPEARALGIEGAIRVRLVVDEHGQVKSKVLLNRLGHGLDELALKRAGEIRFDPALDSDERPVTSVVVWTFNMTLPR